MRQPAYRVLLVVSTLALALSNAVHAQAPPQLDAVAVPDQAWTDAEQRAVPKTKIYIVTADDPSHKRSCRVQSVSDDELLCSRGHGGTRSYKRSQIAALVAPGTMGETLAFVLGFNGAMGASIWGAVVLAASCPACAAATAVAALVFFSAAGVSMIADDAWQPDHILYIAPDQRLTGGLGRLSQ